MKVNYLSQMARNKIKQHVITSSQKINYYFNIVPGVIPEIFLFLSIFSIFGLLPRGEVFIPVFFIVICLFFISRKIKTYQRGLHIWTRGLKTSAKIIRWEKPTANSQPGAVHEYWMQYEADGKVFNHLEHKIYPAGLYEGSITTLFYLPDQPKNVFVPYFHGV
ncbi:MAG: hypothetical protein AAFO69_12710 [Bacteroidota bacterium]